MGTSSLISSINDIPSILSDPMEQSPLAWDLLWNDPIRYIKAVAGVGAFIPICRQEEIDLDIEVQLEENQGFIDNNPRGTAHMFRLVHMKV